MVSNISVDYDKDTWTTRRRDPEDEWDNGGTCSSITNLSLVLREEHSYSDIVVPFDAIVGNPYILVSAIYSTGCSFGYDEAGELEALDIFPLEKMSDAHALRDALQAAYDDPEEDSYNVMHEGKTYYCPWVGYFEHLNELRIDVLVLGN